MRKRAFLGSPKGGGKGEQGRTGYTRGRSQNASTENFAIFAFLMAKRLTFVGRYETIQAKFSKTDTFFVTLRCKKPTI